jgi:ATP-dependent Lon protease
MQVINCSGYNCEDKKTILTKYVWPQILDRIQLTGQLTLTDEAVKYLIEEFSKEEEGVRNLIRAAEMLTARINLLRIADPETRKSYKFGCEIAYPCNVTKDLAMFILQDEAPKKDEVWRSLYN